MNIFSWFKFKPKQQKVKKEFVFQIYEVVKIGDLYRYTVKASNKEEAFKKLVEYFFGQNNNQEIESKHLNTNYPMHEVFEYKNMPYWFAKRISGHVRDKLCDYQKKLEKYCIDNNIKLKSYET